MEIPKYLESVFDKKLCALQSYKHEGLTYPIDFVFQQKVIGKLNVINGKIIALDAFEFTEPEAPFQHLFPQGKFPVELAIATWGDDSRVALARIKFSKTDPIRWEAAIRDDEFISHNSLTYGVDSGVGAFMDTASFDLYSETMQGEGMEGEGTEYWEDLEAELNNCTDSIRWLVWRRKGKNVIMFDSGFGDGSYFSYVGFDNEGQICRLVTDFGILSDERRIPPHF